MSRSRTSMSLLSRAALFAALVFLGTFIIKIPIPSGYIHFGDGFIYVAAALMPPGYAAAAAAVGGVLSDVLAGYAIYAPWTAIIKALAALPTAFFCRKQDINTKIEGQSRLRVFIPLMLCLLISAAIQICGYFAADSVLYGLPAAIANIPLNAIQSAAGIIVFALALSVLRKAFSK